jgi:hypothetical protein
VIVFPIATNRIVNKSFINREITRVKIVYRFTGVFFRSKPSSFSSPFYPNPWINQIIIKCENQITIILFYGDLLLVSTYDLFMFIGIQLAA